MDGAHITAASPEAGGASSSASSASSYGGSASGRSWLRKGVHLRRRRRRQVVAVRGEGRAGGGGGDVQDLALPLGMSFAAVLAQDNWHSHVVYCLPHLEEVEFMGLAGTECELWFMDPCSHAPQNFISAKLMSSVELGIMLFDEGLNSNGQMLRILNCSVPIGGKVLNRCSGSEGRLPPDVLSKMCTSAVKESLTNIYGDKFQSFMSNFEKAFGSTLRTIHLINETPVYEQDMAQCSYKDGISVPDGIKLGGADSLPEIKLDGADSQSQIHDVKTGMPSSPLNNQIVPHAGVNHQLVHLTRSRSNPEIDQQILGVFERSLNEQARSNELKELEIGLTMRKLQLSRSQLALSSDSHMLEKIKVQMGFQKASFKEKKFKAEMEDTKHAELFRKLIDMLLTAVVLMSVCFGYGTYIYSYQRITAATSACAAISREYTSWWMPSSVSAFNSGLLLFKCHVIAATRIFFGILMLLMIGWLIFQRSAMTGPNMPVTFNVMILGVLCGYFGSRCVDTLGGDGNVWLIYWEALCSIHLLGNIWPSLLHSMLYGPISVTQRTKAVHLPYWARRYTFYVLVSLILPCLAGLLPFASLSDWKDLAVQHLKSRFSGSNIED